MQPGAGLYSNMSTSQVNAALAVKGSRWHAAKTRGCERRYTTKPSRSDPTSAAKCWKNLGIVLTNTGHMQESVAPLQKATAADPKDAQSWFLLGGSLTAVIVPSQQGDKLIYQIPPGTTDAYQKCIDAAPTGPTLHRRKKRSTTWRLSAAV